MPTKLEALIKRVDKAIDRLDISEDFSNILKKRATKEFTVIEKNNLANLFVKNKEFDFDLIELQRNRDLSVVGFFTQSLRRKTQKPIESVSDLINRIAHAHKYKIGKLNKKQILELLWAFPNPKKAIHEYYELTDQEMPKIDFNKQLANKRFQQRKIDHETLEQAVGERLATYEWYLSRKSCDCECVVVGQAVNKGKVIDSKRGKMAFLSLIPLNYKGEEGEEPRFDVVVWSDHYPRFLKANIEKGDLVAVYGVRRYNRLRETNQVEGHKFKKVVI